MKKLRVSDLSKYAFCSKRSKLEATRELVEGRISEAMREGSILHAYYSAQYKDNPTMELRSKLPRILRRIIERKELQSLEIVGIMDHIELKGKKVKVMELKTTAHKRLWTNEQEVAILQCQILMWLVKPYLNKLGYEIVGGIVEIRRRGIGGKLIKRIEVKYLPNIEGLIKDISNSWIGLSPMYYPPFYVCKRCPLNIKERCDRYQSCKGRGNRFG